MWYTVKVKYNKQQEDGKIKKVTEAYLIDAETFTDAEARAHEEIGAMVRGGFDVESIAKANLHDVFTDEDADKWYKCSVRYEDVIDGKPKKVTNNYLSAGETVKEADKRVREGLGDLMVDDLEVRSVSVTQLLEIFPRNTTLKAVAQPALNI